MNFGCDLHVASRRHVLFYRIPHGLPRIDVFEYWKLLENGLRWTLICKNFWAPTRQIPKNDGEKNGQCVLENLYSAWNISSDWLKFHGISYGIQWDLMGYTYLVGGLEPWHFMTFHSFGNVIIPTDEVIFFRRVGSTTNQYWMESFHCDDVVHSQISQSRSGPESQRELASSAISLWSVDS